MAPPQTEDIPARKAVAGSMDAQAFAGIVETYQVAVFNLCYRMLGDPHQAEEAAQETFLRAFRSLARYDPGRSVRTWLLSIAVPPCRPRPGSRSDPQRVGRRGRPDASGAQCRRARGCHPDLLV